MKDRITPQNLNFFTKEDVPALVGVLASIVVKELMNSELKTQKVKIFWDSYKHTIPSYKRLFVSWDTKVKLYENYQKSVNSDISEDS